MVAIVMTQVMLLFQFFIKMYYKFAMNFGISSSQLGALNSHIFTAKI